MLLAGDSLASSSDPISVIAPSLGYESESALSTAFKRVMGCSPRNTAGAGIRLSLPMAKKNPLVPIGSNLSQVNVFCVFKSCLVVYPKNCKQE
jgi:AraC-like DNA-binding protein